jgi:SPP1 gp7 family putative phage head morphogenesis protein
MLDHAFDRLSANGALRLEGVKDEIHGVLVSATDAGLNPLATARQLAGQFDQYAGWEFQRLARTEAAYAAEEGTRGQLAELGVERLEVVIAAGACPICQAYDGQVFAIDDTENLPPFHPNCLCATAPAAPEPGQGFGFNS